MVSALRAGRQAAIERVSRPRRAHLVGVGVVTAVIAAIYAVFSLAMYYTFKTSAYDLTIFDQAVRSYAHFQPGISPLKGVHNGFGPHFSVLGDHFSPIIAVLAPLYWIHNSPSTLLVAQAILLALAIPSLWLFARRAFGGGTKATAAAYFVAIAYGLSWPLAEAAAFDFHEAAFAPVLTAIALERFQAGRLRTALVALAALLLVKEDMGLVVAMTGVWIMIRGDRRVGAYFTGAGLAAMALIIEVVMPLEGGSSMRNWQYGQIGATPGKAAIHLVEHPSLFITELIDPHVKVTTVLWLLLPVLFLCLRSWITLLAVPLILERYFANDPFYFVRDYHYNSFLAAILVLAAVDGASKLRRPELRLGWAVAALIVSVALLPKFPLWQLTGNSLWDTSAIVHTQQSLLAEIPAGQDVLMPWPSDPYTLGHVHPINTDFTSVAPEWILTGNLAADVKALNLTLPAGQNHARYIPVATDDGWTIAKLAQP